MITILSTICGTVTTAKKRSTVRRLGPLVLAILCGWTNAALAVQYSFMSVSGTNIPGNGTTVSTFTSGLGNGTITVDHNSTTPNSLGNWGTADNINSAIIPSKFATLFPGSGNVQGHLAQSMYGDPNPPHGFPAPVPNVTTITFHLTPYFGSLPALAFGIWNTTTEVGMPVYNVQFLNGASQMVPPSTVNIMGNDDNTGAGQVLGLHQMLFTPSSGDITFNNAILNANGVHTDALFFNNIPVGTQEIIVTATLPPLNNLGDGVGYYFAEPVPEPSTIVLASIGLVALGVARWKRRRLAGESERHFIAHPTGDMLHSANRSTSPFLLRKDELTAADAEGRKGKTFAAGLCLLRALFALCGQIFFVDRVSARRTSIRHIRSTWPAPAVFFACKTSAIGAGAPRPHGLSD